MQHMASARSLLLNASYEPMRIVTWQKALVLWFQDKVEILEYHSAFARSVSLRFKLPSVLRLKSYVRPRANHAVRFCRENVYIRDNYTCQYCGEKFSAKQLTLDHVVPASQNGPKNWTNVVSACRDCNQRKANRTPRTANMPLLTEPHTPSWLPTLQLEISEDHVPPDWAPYLRLKTG
ncbi:HNH endonuclease [Bdellovibrio sp. NC01]|nr:HNH endonuclease [Bdellovibrio sp. NC01]